MTAHKWQFPARFRRHAFGWRSDVAIDRIKEALTEIKQVARKEPVLAAEGAIKLLEKLSPALEHVDSSSGALGSMVNKAIEVLAAVIARADVAPALRQRWLERLWQAMQDDGVPYLESLGDYWGELCVTPELASLWADIFMPVVEHVRSPNAPGHGYFKGTTACMSCLFAVGRYGELFALIDQSRHKWWYERRWGVKALVAMGKKAEAVRYAEDSREHSRLDGQIAQACEEILLSSGLADEAYQRYAIEANQGTTYLATFRAIAKKYPSIKPEQVLRDLVTSTPGAEGKWFAAAKDAGLFNLAIELVTRGPTDPRTLTRAARDYGDDQPAFALAAGMAALDWIARGHGYEITETDVLDAHTAVMHCAAAAGVAPEQINSQIKQMDSTPQGKVIQVILAGRLRG